MISLTVIATILLMHWVADFVCQTDKMARNKSKSLKWLTIHALTYILIFTPLWIGGYVPFAWIAINFVAHWYTDFVTSRISSHFYKEGKIHQFFVVVGADQVIHYMTLFFTYAWLTLR